ncbi:YwdI family protein [Lysinibacillus sp. SGAir0095]|uniref:YwdI family protein n=1 Tax=Lysinibacillus sp. SGAir0095 TaxID=2070463 RepID=UPI0010CD11B0|nr:YwdI family protein [Lysinibacillus sp. SGAir0095]QCR31373.1 hypothetical protein C1N55_04005 [Lysinibacillus sp. SGAir0095]
MISYQALLLEIEQLVAGTKNSTDEQYIREQLSAIRALCNVGLSNGNQNSTTKVQAYTSALITQPLQSFQSNPISTQSPNIVQNSNTLNGGKLKEDDANGESIFDF